jgi:hypothetical protein
VEVAQRPALAGAQHVLAEQQLQLQPADRVGDDVARVEGDAVDGRLRRRVGEAGVLLEEVDRLLDAPLARGELRVDDGAGAAHPLPAGGVEAGVEAVAVEPEAHQHLLAVERPALGEGGVALQPADQVGMAPGDRELHEMSGHRLVRPRRPDPVAVEVLVHVEPLRRLLERARRRDEVVAGARLREQPRRIHRGPRRDRLQERRRLDDLHRAEPLRHGDDVVLLYEGRQLGEPVAVVAHQRRAAGRQAAAARRAERQVALSRQRRQPRFLGPAMRQLVAGHVLDLGRIEGQQQLLAQHPLVGRLADDVIHRPRRGLGVEHPTGLDDGREHRVARRHEAGQGRRPSGHLRACGLAQGAAKEIGNAGELLGADRALQSARLGHQLLPGDDVGGALLQRATTSSQARSRSAWTAPSRPTIGRCRNWAKIACTRRSAGSA